MTLHIRNITDSADRYARSANRSIAKSLHNARYGSCCLHWRQCYGARTYALSNRYRHSCRSIVIAHAAYSHRLASRRDVAERELTLRIRNITDSADRYACSANRSIARSIYPTGYGSCCLHRRQCYGARAHALSNRYRHICRSIVIAHAAYSHRLASRRDVAEREVTLRIRNITDAADRYARSANRSIARSIYHTGYRSCCLHWRQCYGARTYALSNRYRHSCRSIVIAHAAYSHRLASRRNVAEREVTLRIRDVTDSANRYTRSANRSISRSLHDACYQSRRCYRYYEGVCNNSSLRIYSLCCYRYRTVCNRRQQ